jgi:hypothetical protein
MFALTAKYNVLFHGNESLDSEVNQLFNTYNENYWTLLPIEPLTVGEGKISLGPSEKKPSRRFKNIASMSKARSITPKWTRHICFWASPDTTINVLFLPLKLSIISWQNILPAIK